MLISFGSAWPFSIYRSYKSKSIEGKSIIFLLILMIGYCAGILHKINYSRDYVVILYTINLCMVMIDTGLYVRNYKKSKISG